MMTHHNHEAATIAAMHEQAAPPDLEYTPIADRLPELVRASEIADLRARVAELEAAVWKNCRDWDNAPPAAEWWAVDADGSAWFYEGEPSIQAQAWGGVGVWVLYHAGFVPLAALGLDWRDTLTARPMDAQP